MHFDKQPQQTQPQPEESRSFSSWATVSSWTDIAPVGLRKLAGLFKARLSTMMFEEAPERPISISRMSKKVFESPEPAKPGVFFRNVPHTSQDYRFSKLLD